MGTSVEVVFSEEWRLHAPENVPDLGCFSLCTKWSVALLPKDGQLMAQTVTLKLFSEHDTGEQPLPIQTMVGCKTISLVGDKEHAQDRKARSLAFQRALEDYQDIADTNVQYALSSTPRMLVVHLRLCGSKRPFARASLSINGVSKEVRFDAMGFELWGKSGIQWSRQIVGLPLEVV